jgi:hypothetical protein
MSEGVLVHRHHDAVPTAAALDFHSSFESLNNDCLVNILSYLSTDDLNNIITVVNKACNKARDSESLDQTRTAIITCSDLRTRSTVSSLCAALGNASKTLTTSKFRKLKIVGMEKLENEYCTLAAASPLVNVIALELASLHPISEEVESTVLPEYVLNRLTSLLPNVAYMTLNGVNFPNPRFCHEMQNLSEIVWNGGHLSIRGNVMGRNRMREITLEKCVLEFGCYYFVTGLAFYDCRQSLERLSISSDTMWCVDCRGEKHAKHAFTQGMLMKIFQGLPNLCWFKSDLTQENIAILQHECPDVTFVQNEQVEQRHMSASEEQQLAESAAAAASASTGFIAEAGSFDSPFLPWFVPYS